MYLCRGISLFLFQGPGKRKECYIAAHNKSERGNKYTFFFQRSNAICRYLLTILDHVHTLRFRFVPKGNEAILLVRNDVIQKIIQ